MPNGTQLRFGGRTVFPADDVDLPEVLALTAYAVGAVVAARMAIHLLGKAFGWSR